MPEKLYISGPMQNRPGFNFALFAEAKRAAREAFMPHYNVINPAENFEGRTDLSREVYLELALRQVDECDAIALLPGWSESAGARLELVRAMWYGVDVFEYEPADRSFTKASYDAIQATLLATAQPVSDAPFVPVQTIEAEAAGLVRNGQRQKDYGHPRGDFDTIARIWDAIIGRRQVTAELVALCMAGLKLARLSATPQHHDSKVDVIGYMICLDRLDEPLTLEQINADRARRGLEPFGELAA